MDVREQKEALRLEMKARRALLNESARARASWALCERVFDWLELHWLSRYRATPTMGVPTVGASIGVYLARPPEISLDPLLATLLRAQVPLAAPRVDVARGEMSFWRLDGLEDLEIGPWNVRQPPAAQRIENLSLVIVPGLAFDRSGGRLGTGGGWYDRVLGAVSVRVGVGFDVQLVAQVPLETHDAPMNFVATPERWLEIAAAP